MIGLSELIAPCSVIDISRKCVDTEEGRNYLLSVDDVFEFEAVHGELAAGTIVLIRTGWARHWKDGPKAYLGYDEATQGPFHPERASLSFPGISAEAAHLFVARRVAGVGLDTASIDYGRSRDFIVHQILLGAGIYGIENVSSAIVALPPKGSTLFVLPMKITGGSGAPSRIVALIPDERL
jgi:kynurenine formamidase